MVITVTDLFILCRYAEGSGSAALFEDVSSIKFISPTDLICTDTDNSCIRLIDLSQTPAGTATFAGKCNTKKSRDGHRLNYALLELPRRMEMNKNRSKVFVLEKNSLRAVDLESDNVTTIVALDSFPYDMVLSGDDILYFAEGTRVFLFNLNSLQQSVVAGGDSEGNAVGPFELTRFKKARGLLLMPDLETDNLLVLDLETTRSACFKLIIVIIILIIVQ